MTRPTAVYSTRTDMRVLASLVSYWNSRGLYPKSISELHRLSMELFVEILQKQGLSRTFGSTMEAKNFLESAGLLKSLNPRNKKTLITQLQKEELISQGIDPSYTQVKTSNTIANDQVERAQEILKQKLEDEDSSGIIGEFFGEKEKE